MQSENFNKGYALNSTVEIVQNCTSIGGVNPTHICYGKIIRYTMQQVVIKNEHGNEMRFWLARNRLVNQAYPEMPTYLIKC